MQCFALNINASESIQLTRFEPRATAIAQIIIAPAMGVSQAFYQALALWLSQQGYAVTTFDYRAMGSSQDKALKDYSLDILS